MQEDCKALPCNKEGEASPGLPPVPTNMSVEEQTTWAQVAAKANAKAAEAQAQAFAEAKAELEAKGLLKQPTATEPTGARLSRADEEPATKWQRSRDRSRTPAGSQTQPGSAEGDTGDVAMGETHDTKPADPPPAPTDVGQENVSATTPNKEEVARAAQEFYEKALCDASKALNEEL